ncbi:DNA repair protein RAD50 [Holothuria leucospilota]|uniref:DNA repair protein RAD50 n=1 Tax=Holothuria leucospilota TaxID=206669 RepID=A0A9Q1BRS0_HOLLE|nr:DNA repair protein RAD50 [Holothuria leucospilota]
MSSIVKLTIKGIRSFSHEEEQTLKFLRPLTLITGHNGAGKTTIIECLRYACSGFFPPGAQTSCFVRDLKKAGSSKVEGFVKLIFKDQGSNKITVRRGFTVSKKKTKIEFQSLPPVIRRKGDGKTQEKRSRCQKVKDLNEEMVDGLGVSQTIMVNVIFCHQVESNWPLSDGKHLKSKFDEIFGATRYIKALETIKKLRRELASKINELKIQIENNKEWKKEAKQKMLQEMRDKDSHFQKLEVTIGQLKARIHEMKLSCGELQNVCKRSNVNILENEIEEQSKTRIEKERERNDMLKELDKQTKCEVALKIEKGKLEQDLKQMEELQQKVWECVGTLSSMLPVCKFERDWNEVRPLVDALEEEKRQKELQLDAISKEISKLSQNQQAKVEIWQEEMKILQADIVDIRNSFDGEVRELLKTSDNLYSKLYNFYSDQRLELQQAQEKLQAKKLEQCREECTKLYLIKQIEQKQRKLEQLEQLLNTDSENQEVEQRLAQMSQHDVNRGKQRSYRANSRTFKRGKDLTFSSGVDTLCPCCNGDLMESEDRVKILKGKVCYYFIACVCRIVSSLWWWKYIMFRLLRFMK